MTEQQTPRWYAERAGLNAKTDEDRAMEHEKLGPFDSRDEARRVVPLPTERAKPTAPTSVTVALNVADLSPRMRTALLNTRHMAPEDRLDGNDLSGTIVALINRELVEAGGDGRRLPLTEVGLRARARLEEPDERAGAALDAELTAPVVERWTHSRALGYLEQAVRNVFGRDNLSAHSAAELREALAAVELHCPTGV